MDLASFQIRDRHSEVCNFFSVKSFNHFFSTFFTAWLEDVHGEKSSYFLHDLFR